MPGSSPSLHLFKQPCAALVLHCQSNSPIPTNIFTSILSPRVQLETKVVPRSICKFSEAQERTPSCSLINHPENLSGAACTTCPHLFDLTFQPDEASTLRLGGPSSLHLMDGDSGGER